MTNPPPSPFARLRLHLAGVPDPRSTDAELVARYAASRDEVAFAELVRRHGPLVLAVCRRVTGNRDDADDAFQASFLVLARKPDRVRPDSPLAAWLYGVAVRAARKAVARTARRRSRETPSPDLPDVPDRSVSSDPEVVRAVLDEVARLPHATRAAVMLCELEGRSRAAAARELGVPEGTLSSRLAAARKTLAARFRDRGLAPAVLAAVAGSVACPVLAADAVRLGGASASPDPRVEQLSEAVMRSGFSVRVAVASAAAVVVCFGFALGGSDPAPAPKPAARLQPSPRQAEAKPAAPVNRILFYRAGHLTLIDPDGKGEKQVSEDRAKFHPGDAKLSPDGKTLAFLVQTAEAPKDGRDPQRKLYVRGLDEKEPGTDTGVTCQTFAWSPDGAEIACTDFTDPPPGKEIPDAVSAVYNLKSKEKTPLKLPTDHAVTDWSRDGKHFVTTSMRVEKDGMRAKLHLMNRDGTEHKAVTHGKTMAAYGRLSADGKRLLALTFELVEESPAEKKVRDEKGMLPPRPKPVLSVVEVATGTVTTVGDVPLNGEVQGYCWSPDGRKIAYAWRERHEGDPKDLVQKETESFLVVCDPDGKNAKTIATEKGNGQWIITIAHVDWR